MIKRIVTERYLMYGMAMHIIASVKITGCTDINNLKTAIDFGVNRFESLRSRVLQDTDGEAYYVLKDERTNPSIEVRNYHTDLETLTNEQEKIPFRFDRGEMIRFIIEDLDGYFNMRIIEQHLGGDGKSVLMLIDEIMNNLDAIEKGTFTYEDKPMLPLNLISEEFLRENLPVSDLLKCDIDSFNDMWSKEKRIFTYWDYLGIFKKYWCAHKTGVKVLKVNQEDMAKLVSMSKEHHVSINSILLTAVARAFARTENFVVVVDGMPEARKGMGNYAGAVCVETLYDEEKTFWENALYIHKQVHTQLQDKKQAYFSTALNNLLDVNLFDATSFEGTGCYENEIAMKYNDAFCMNRKGPAFMISNLGRAGLSETSKVNVEEIEISSPMQPNGNCNCGVVTANGIMNIVMEYNKDAEFDYVKMLSELENQLKELVKEEVVLFA